MKRVFVSSLNDELKNKITAIQKIVLENKKVSDRIIAIEHAGFQVDFGKVPSGGLNSIHEKKDCYIITISSQKNWTQAYYVKIKK